MALIDKTIEQYLRGKVEYQITDLTIDTILIDRGVESGALISDLTKAKRDLCTADLYLYLADRSPSTRSSVEDSDGDWKHVEGSSSLSASDKRRLREMAKSIYVENGECASMRKVTIINM